MNDLPPKKFEPCHLISLSIIQSHFLLLKEGQQPVLSLLRKPNLLVLTMTTTTTTTMTTPAPQTETTTKTSNAVWYVFVIAQFLAFSVIYDGASLSLTLEQDQFLEVPTSKNAAILTTNVTANAITSTKKITKTISTPIRPTRLPSLEELTAIPANLSCPNGTSIFENIVLPKEITHTGRKIPRVVHVTAKSRCVTKEVRRHIKKWIFADHSLYFHDDEAAYKLLDYAIKDAHGHELVEGISKSVLCITSGATMSDFWRLVLLYHYGGVYTDIDNAPGENYTNDYIQPETDSFFYIEQVGIITQFYMASSRHHPLLLHMLNHCWKSLYNEANNVMKNNPAVNTGPKAAKRGIILFLKAHNFTTDGYLKAGTYYGGVGSDLQSSLPWYNETILQMDNTTTYNEYAKASDLQNRSVTIVGSKKDNRKYIDRQGLKRKQKARIWDKMNMTHYFDKKIPRTNKISCPQHIERMHKLSANETSFYFQKTKIADLLPQYEFREKYFHWFDVNTNEMLVPWSKNERNDLK